MGVLIAYLLGILTAIQRKNKDRRDTDQHNDDDHTFPEGPISVVCIPPTLSDQDRAKQKTQKRRKNIKFLVQVGSLIVLIVYAGFTIAIWHQTKEANRISRSNAPRPWIGIDEGGIQIARTPKFAWPATPSDLPTITLDLMLPIKNFGGAPGLHESSAAWIIPVDMSKGFSVEQAPIDLLDTLCRFSKGMGDNLLPGAAIHPLQPALYYAGKIKGTHLSVSWIAVCIKYEDSSQHMVHRSKYLYMSSHEPGLTPVQASSSHPDWTYVPVTGLLLWNAEAD
jgi:hypothetical protein